MNGKDRVELSEEVLFLPDNLIVLDASILFPVIAPRKKRNVEFLQKCRERYRPSKEITYLDRKHDAKNDRKLIEFVNYLEAGRFHQIGYYFGVSIHVFNELVWISDMSTREDVAKWFSNFDSYVYKIYLSLTDFRKKYKSLWDLEKIHSDADFSLLVAALVLNRPFATQDYSSFDNSIYNILREVYREKWGPNNRFERHDVVSLMSRLNTSNPTIAYQPRISV